MGGNGVSVNRNYAYDAGQRLCKTVEPELGATLQDYDPAGNVASLRRNRQPEHRARRESLRAAA